MNSVYRTCSLSLLLSFGSLVPIKAQPFLPLAVENATWTMFHYNGFESTSIFHAYKVQGDTILGNETYKRVFDIGLLNGPEGGYYQFTHPRLIALMRDDTTAGKVYAVFVSPYPGMDSCSVLPTEMLLYDFGIVAGDTISDCRSDGYEPIMIIDSIFTKYTFDLDRRIWNAGGFETLIEGVGYARGLFTSANDIFYDQYSSSLIDYCIGTNFECGIFTSTLTQANINNPTLYPNPVRDIIYIQSDNPFAFAQIFSTHGTLLDQQMLNDSQSLHIPDYPQGLYFLVLRNEKRGTVTSRFVKE